MYFSKKLAVVMAVSLFTAFFTANAAFADTIGFVNSQKLVLQHPKFHQVQEQIKTMNEKKTKEAKEAIDKIADEQKKVQEYQNRRQDAAQEESKLMAPIFKDVELAIRKVANAKKVNVVVDENAVFYGGINITEDVITELKKK
ncbi:MAG: OmpH family outer membrane protein [Synergistaceae bacterium]|jgi:outer membrane protein|nr:OmpH family outer membrane protein [Synergistaceae bacterium]